MLYSQTYALKRIIHIKLIFMNILLHEKVEIEYLHFFL